METQGLLVLAGMPIGDVEDASPALLRALAAADVVAAEDTRRFQAFLGRAGATSQARVMSYFEGNEAARTPELVELLRDGLRVVLVTDAGMPSVSDPGYRLVAAAIAAGIRVTAVPGPSAVLTALALSGLATDRFCFEGFLPRKAGARRAALTELAGERRTMVFFEAPHRVADMLADAAAVLGADRGAAVCRELTKTYEEVRRGGLADLAAWAADGVLGEVTVVVAGAPSGERLPLSEALDEVRRRVADGEKRSSAAASVAAASGHDRRELYDGSRS
ncbi:MAG: 16S rRNA (cytidine(1402)-2'-O)-methyltransferase [Actinobacteria bacterium]|nr:16S rRNA (cytidine(1402)-2'-O)-methyltransferase [Actinomycetota bacterium]